MKSIKRKTSRVPSGSVNRLVVLRDYVAGGRTPRRLPQIFRDQTGFAAPRIFIDDTPEDRQAIQPVLQQIMMKARRRQCSASGH